jgi:hypothetical protein
MAFSQPIPRPFSERGIWVYAPATPGVFGISNSRGWIHVGSANNIREALLECLRGREARLLESAPTGFVFEPCVPEIHASRRLQLVAEYDPILERSHTRSATQAHL